MDVPKLNGFEAWRRIVEPILSTSLAMRISLPKTAWNPSPAKLIHDYGRCLENFETDYRRYLEVDPRRKAASLAVWRTQRQRWRRLRPTSALWSATR